MATERPVLHREPPVRGIGLWLIGLVLIAALAVIVIDRLQPTSQGSGAAAVQQSQAGADRAISGPGQHDVQAALRQSQSADQAFSGWGFRDVQAAEQVQTGLTQASAGSGLRDDPVQTRLSEAKNYP